MTSRSTQHASQVPFLTAIRQAVAPHCEAPRTRHDVPGLFQDAAPALPRERIRGRSDMESAALVDLFRDNCEILNISLQLAADLSEAARLIVDIVRESQPEFGEEKHIMQHHHPDILGLGLWRCFPDTPVAVHTTFNQDPDLREKTEAAYIGITAADCGIAESATLIQLTGPGRPRSTSLVPSIHIGLLQRTQLVRSLDEAYQLLMDHPLPDSFTFISGPSKTADIEAHMVHGAHGPREMHVLIVG